MKSHNLKGFLTETECNNLTEYLNKKWHVYGDYSPAAPDTNPVSTNIVSHIDASSSDLYEVGDWVNATGLDHQHIIKQYNQVNPEARFNIINLNSIDLIEERYKPDIDITICFNAQTLSNSKNIAIKEGKHFLVSPKKYNLGKEVYLNEIIHLPYIEITNLLSLYSDSSIMNYFIKNELEMNFHLKSDSYSSALAIVSEGVGVSIIDDNTITKADDRLVNISNILDTEFGYRVNAIVKKDIANNQCNDFFNYLNEQI